jgi:hypothetical protein
MSRPGDRVANGQITLEASFQGLAAESTKSATSDGLANSPATSVMKQPSVYGKVKQQGQKKLKEQLDYDTMCLVCVGGIPPTAVDLPGWKKL